MLKVALSGCNGRMGQTISQLCRNTDDIRVVAGFDVYTEKLSSYPVYADPFEFSAPCEVIIDFSNAAALENLIRYALTRKLPLVLSTTGHSPNQNQLILEASKSIPVFKSANMSVGINLLMELLAKCGRVLGGEYDVEIVERHHNQKVDAPSGTAIMLADAVASALPFEPDYVYDRHNLHKKRDKHEIGMHSVRGGTVVGEHEVIFAGHDETIEIRHTILSREVFAKGAINAARFLSTVKAPGLYSMKDFVNR